MHERVVCLFFKNTAPVFEIAEACYRFSPQVAVRPSETADSAIFLEVGRCKNLYSESSLLARLGVLAQRFGQTPQFGIANDAPTALAMARFAKRSREELPLEALADYASPFLPLFEGNNLFPKIDRIVLSLKKLGLTQLGELLKLPKSNLASRFGIEGSELYARVRGQTSLVWPRFYPTEKISERAELHELSEFGVCSDLEPLLFILKNLADRMMARLRGRAERVATLELKLDLEKGSRCWNFELPVPQSSVPGLLPLLRDRLDFDLNKTPLEHAIVRIEITVLETAPGYRSQRDLFCPKEEEAEAWDALVARLCQKLGKENAFVATPANRHLPEKAWGRAIQALDRLPLELPPRPSRVLKSPEALRKEGRSLVGAKRWNIAEWHGPERISVEWWMDPELRGFNRDYFRVVTETGEQLWVFSVPSRPELYLHGYFD